MKNKAKELRDAIEKVIRSQRSEQLTAVVELYKHFYLKEDIDISKYTDEDIREFKKNFRKMPRGVRMWFTDTALNELEKRKSIIRKE